MYFFLSSFWREVIVPLAGDQKSEITEATEIYKLSIFISILCYRYPLLLFADRKYFQNENSITERSASESIM